MSPIFSVGNEILQLAPHCVPPSSLRSKNNKVVLWVLRVFLHLSYANKFTLNRLDDGVRFRIAQTFVPQHRGELLHRGLGTPDGRMIIGQMEQWEGGSDRSRNSQPNKLHMPRTTAVESFQHSRRRHIQGIQIRRGWRGQVLHPLYGLVWASNHPLVESGWVWLSLVKSVVEFGWVWLSLVEFGWVWLSLVESG